MASINPFQETKKMISCFATVCINHFEEKYICRYTTAYDNEFQKHSIPRNKLCLTKDAVPTLNLKIDPPPPSNTNHTKRGSAGRVNLQLARQKREKRRERMRNLATGRKKPAGRTKKAPAYDREKDYFLGSNRIESDSEKIVIALRMSCQPLLKDLHNGRNLCKIPKHKHENPIFWSCDETFAFMKHITPVKGVAQNFKAEGIDGESLMSLTKADLKKYFSLDERIADKISSSIQQLRKETIESYVDI